MVAGPKMRAKCTVVRDSRSSTANERECSHTCDSDSARCRILTGSELVGLVAELRELL